MKTNKPKVMQSILGVPMLWYVYNVLPASISKSDVWTVVGFGHEQLQDIFSDYRQRFVHQSEQLGTGHALQCALPYLKQSGYSHCLVLNGDAPLLQTKALENFLLEAKQSKAGLAFMSVEMDDPTGYGRVVRDKKGTLSRVVEDKDLNAEHFSAADILEVNAGIYYIDLEKVGHYLDFLDKNNRQQEYYITQLVDLFIKGREDVLAVCCGRDSNFLGINSPEDLVLAEEVLRKRIVHSLLGQGVIVRNPEQVRIGPLTIIETGTDLTGPLEIYGQSNIQNDVSINSHVWLKDVHIGQGCRINSFSHLEGVHVDNNCEIGPFARLRPGTELKQEVRIGNFVEVKKSIIGKASKVNHLSYVGDADLGEGCNVGAGTITCNYDGKQKHKTKIGKDVFIGSNTALVAPLELGDESLIGAGSVITKKVPPGNLAVARSRQKNLQWKKNKE